MRTAIYPGTFDPITLGHADVIKKSLKIVDKLIVAVSATQHKDYYFSIDERIEIIKRSLFSDLNVSKKKILIIPFESLTINLCKKYKASIIIRGLRVVSDFEYEFQLAGMNKKLDNNIETIFLMSEVENQVISSKFVKEIAKLKGNIGKFVTKSVIKAIKEKDWKRLMKKILIFIFTILLITTNKSQTKESTMILKLKNGEVEIELFDKIAPNHVKRFKALANEGKYDGVVFHRVIDGFMAQTGDVKFGNSNSPNYNLDLAGTGGSDLPDLKAEFSDTAHNRGVLSMARSSDPNSANSQFFIVFESAPHLDRNYSAFGKVTKGMEFIDKIKRGEGPNGSVENPDKIITLRSKK